VSRGGAQMASGRLMSNAHRAGTNEEKWGGTGQKQLVAKNSENGKECPCFCGSAVLQMVAQLKTGAPCI
jgi:hypothetical protein